MVPSMCKIQKVVEGALHVLTYPLLVLCSKPYGGLGVIDPLIVEVLTLEDGVIFAN
jgi:hypothetical protein